MKEKQKNVIKLFNCKFTFMKFNLFLAIALFILINTSTAFAATTYINNSNGQNISIGNSLFLDQTNNRVGIGTTTPAAPLHIARDSESLRISGSSAYISYYNTSPTPARQAYIQYVQSTNNLALVNELSGSMTFYTSNNLAMTLSSDGNLGIGTGSPSEKLEVNGNIKLSEGVGAYGRGRVQAISAGDLIAYTLNSTSRVWDLISIVSSSPDYFAIKDSTAGLERLRINDDGTIKFNAYGAGTATFDSGGAITSVSDVRLKNVIGNYTTGLNQVLKLEPILYKYNNLSGLEQDYTYAGFSAQQVIDYIPEAIGMNNKGYYTFNDRPIIAALVNSIKEQQKEIETTKKLNQKLKSKLEKMEERLSALEAK